MAEDQDNSQKTEDPTQKRLEEARRKGDVAKSQDVPAWFLLMTAAGIVAGAGPVMRMIADPLVRIFDHPQSFHLADGGAMNMARALLMALLAPMGVIFATLLVGSVVGHVIQVPPLWTLEKMKPDLEKLSPAKGLSRMFGVEQFKSPGFRPGKQVPFFFVWLPKTIRHFSSAFALSWQQLQAEHAAVADGVRRNQTAAFLLEDRRQNRCRRHAVANRHHLIPGALIVG